MSNFGETLFGGSRIIRWSLTPFVILFAILMPGLLDKWTPMGIVVMAGMEFMCIALLAGFWLPSRFGRWAFRGLAGAVFLAYLAYLIDEFFFSETPFSMFESRANASPRNALLGFIVIGLPSLWYAILGRFSLSPTQPESKIDDPDVEPDDDAA